MNCIYDKNSNACRECAMRFDCFHKQVLQRNEEERKITRELTLAK